MLKGFKDSLFTKLTTVATQGGVKRHAAYLFAGALALTVGAPQSNQEARSVTSLAFQTMGFGVVVAILLAFLLVLGSSAPLLMQLGGIFHYLGIPELGPGVLFVSGLLVACHQRGRMVIHGLEAKAE